MEVKEYLNPVLNIQRRGESLAQVEESEIYEDRNN